MAALRKLNVRGMIVEIWETSFRIEGMSQAVQVGPNLSDERVKQIINTIYDHVRDGATKNAQDRVLNKINQVAEELIRGDPTKKTLFFPR